MGCTGCLQPPDPVHCFPDLDPRPSWYSNPMALASCKILSCESESSHCVGQSTVFSSVFKPGCRGTQESPHWVNMSSSRHGYQFVLTLASQGVTKQALVCTGSLLFAWGLWIFILFVGSCLHLDSTALALAASVCGMWSSHLAPYPSTGHPMYTITTTSCYS